MSWKANLELEEQPLSCVIPTYAQDIARLISINPTLHPGSYPLVFHKVAVQVLCFTLYASTIQRTIINDQISLYGYADDHGLRMTCKPDAESEISTVKDLQDCLSSVKDWMDENQLKMNSSKTEIIIFGSR